MMYPRLKLARNLLAAEGAILVSADDHEVAGLRHVMNEVFGQQNFQADVSWQKRYTRSNNTQDFTTVVERILVFSRSDRFRVNLLPRTDEADGRYTNPDGDTRGPWKGASFLNPATPLQRPNLCYPITNPNTGAVTLPTTNAWRRSASEFQRLAEGDLLYWGIDGKSPIPSIKMFLSEARGMTPINFWDHNYAGNTDDGTRDLADLFDAKIFDNPKPVRLIERILEHITDSESTVLDFFAGSSTTAHAVLAQNAADGGNRQFIMVQLDEAVDPKSEAGKAGYSNIAELSRERIRRAGRKIKDDAGLEGESLDIGFRTLKIDSTNRTDVLRTPDETDQLALGELEASIKPGRTAEDLLFQVLLEWGLTLDLPIVRESVEGQEVFVVDGGALIACFEENVAPETIRAIAARKPLRAVFRDSAFTTDAARINADQIFHELHPALDTTRDLKTL